MVFRGRSAVVVHGLRAAAVSVLYPGLRFPDPLWVILMCGWSVAAGCSWFRFGPPSLSLFGPLRGHLRGMFHQTALRH